MKKHYLSRPELFLVGLLLGALLLSPVIMGVPLPLTGAKLVGQDFTVLDDSSDLVFAKGGGGKPDKAEKAEIHVRSVGKSKGQDDDYLMRGRDVLIIAEVFGEIANPIGTFDVYLSIDDGQEVLMTQRSEYIHDYNAAVYDATWSIPSNCKTGRHSVTVIGYPPSSPKPISDTHTVMVVDEWTAQLEFEIDYMRHPEDATRFRPSTDVLEYWVDYWQDHAVDVSYYIDDNDDVPYIAALNTSDQAFWDLEKLHNSHSLQNQGLDPFAGDWYATPYKWMLWADYHVYESVGGATWIAADPLKDRSYPDMLGGNYITVFKGMIDDYYAPAGLEFGGEVVVTMHEAGHSIGIGVLRYDFSEYYDPDSYSVMHWMCNENAGLTDSWFYSWFEWSKRNIEYYPPTN